MICPLFFIFHCYQENAELRSLAGTNWSCLNNEGSNQNLKQSALSSLECFNTPNVRQTSSSFFSSPFSRTLYNHIFKQLYTSHNLNYKMIHMWFNFCSCVKQKITTDYDHDQVGLVAYDGAVQSFQAHDQVIYPNQQMNGRAENVPQIEHLPLYANNFCSFSI
jgi:hypothetical protein